MPSGGARVVSGPPPNPNALRRDRDSAEWVRLPAAGRAGPAPEWPLAGNRGRGKERELQVWEEEWRRPQAIMWERLGLIREVAIYVRTLCAAERPVTTPKDIVPMRTLLRQQQDALGLSVPGMLRNRWLIVEEGAANADRRTPQGRSARERYELLEGGATATG